MAGLARITDLTPSFLSFWREAGTLPEAERLRAWQERYYEPNREILDLYFSRWGRRERLGDTLGAIETTAHLIAARDARLQTDVGEAIERVCQIMGLLPTPLNVVALVGVRGANGWGYLHRRVPTLFLAMEYQYPSDLAWRVLISHESAHVLHFLAIAQANPDTVSALLADMERLLSHIGLACFYEGLAVVASQRAYPNADEPTLYWPGSGRDAQPWVVRCHGAATQLYQELLDCADVSGNDQIYRRYFWSEAAVGLPSDIPERSGYFTGVQAINCLLREGRDLPSLCRLPPDAAVNAIKHALRQLLGRTGR